MRTSRPFARAAPRRAPVPAAQALAWVLLLVLAACAPAASPVPDVAPPTGGAASPATPTAAATQAAVEPGPSPLPAEPGAGPATPALAPGKPLAWSLAPDGALLVLDDGGRVHDLAPGDLAVRASSAPLSGAAGEDVFLAAGDDLVAVASAALSETVVLARDGLGEVARLPGYGPLALDGDGRLLMLPRGLEQPATGYNHEIWAYDLAAPTAPPRTVRDTGWSLDDLRVDLAGRRLYVLTSSVMASPPHQGQAWRACDLDSLEVVADYAWERGRLTLPAVHPGSGELLGSRVGLNGSRRLLIQDAAGVEVRHFATLDGQPVVDPGGLWIYVLRPVGLWVLAYDDLAVEAALPFAGPPPADLLLSPDGQWLYLLGNGWLEARSAAEVRQAGMAAVSPFPVSWLAGQPLPDALQARAFPAPAMQDGGAAFVQVVNGLGEPQATHVSADGGRTWRLLASLARPELAGTRLLGLSPDYAQDRTLAALGPDGLLRSTDGGATWQAWQPRVAFASEREGNREIYTADLGGHDVQRLTDNPAAEENPAWSPAWTRLAYQSDRGGNWDIWSQQAGCLPQAGDETGCDLRRLTGDPGDDLLPAWSPDGRSIAFVSTRDGNPEIYVMDADGGNQRRLTFDPGGDWRPAWLPDSRHLLFVSSRAGTNDIYQVAVPAAGDPPLSAEAGVLPVIAGPADDRDPATRLGGNFLFLSDRDGQVATYQARAGDPSSVFRPFGPPERAEGHPAGLPTDPYTIRSILVTAPAGDNDDLFLVSYSSYTPFATSPAWDGQPAVEATPWEPDLAASQAWLAGLPD